jgi:hypothetical protein
MRRVFVLLTVAALIGLFPGSAIADDDNRPQAVPFTFVGEAGDCGPAAGSRIVTAAWLGGMGLPDNGGPNATTPNDRHSGLLLNKNGPTADCSSSGARITGVRGMTVTATSTLGFDYRLGGHCGAGAPRFNVTARPTSGPDTFHFVGGCANAVSTPAPQDPTEWARVRFLLTNPAQAFPPVPVGSRIVSISILYDEGTDNPAGTSDPVGVGLAVIDNIFIDGRTITRGSNDRGGDGDGDGDNDDDDDDDDDDDEDDD